ncbi:hypothetical protein FRC09_007060, partial [Ceratobasidium sp. 395]
EQAQSVRQEWDSPDDEPSSRKRSCSRGKGRAGAPSEGSAAQTLGPLHNAGTGTAPPRPTARGNQEWRQVRGHWVPTSASPSTVNRWEQMSDAEISTAILGKACWETGNINVAQRELYKAVRGTPIQSQSGLVNRILAFATEMLKVSNHPLLQKRWQPEIRIGENGAANIINVLACDWWHALRAMYQGQCNGELFRAKS